MSKIEKIEDSAGRGMALSLTRRKATPSIRVKCGCCNEAVVIFFDREPTGQTNVDTLEINGVMGTIDQWRQILLPLLAIRK